MTLLIAFGRSCAGLACSIEVFLAAEFFSGKLAGT
jgi:hypothetical protein